MSGGEQHQLYGGEEQAGSDHAMEGGNQLLYGVEIVLVEDQGDE